MLKFQWPVMRRDWLRWSANTVALLGFLLSLHSARAAPISFACIGDYGSAYVSTRQVANLIKGWRPDFIITVGDNNYPAGSGTTIDRNIGQFYHDFISPYKGRYGRGAITNRFFPCLGNHDWRTGDAQPYLDYFTLPGNERYYTFTRGPVQLFCLDSDTREPDGCTTNSIQAQWLEKQMSASRAVWKIVCFHHAPYSSGYYHGSWTNESHHMRWPFHEWGAHAVLTGHDHIYERLQVNGLVYFVNGVGGDSRDPLHFPLVPGSARQFTADFGALRVDAAENYLLFRFFTWRGALIDQYRLGMPAGGVGRTRGGPSVPELQEFRLLEKVALDVSRF
jgi:hypothetical protein